ncbi:MAG: hypothetical protein KAH54_09640 [Candidatus Sabulitectum sp.]|nr:hypothetical protein [Candidatus Sabulitectum sp.]
MDDGARTNFEAIEIITRMRERLEPGSTIVFTPHYSSSMSRRVADGRRRKSVQFLDRMEEEFSPDLSFLAAGELMIQRGSLKHMEEIRYPGTGWVLVEFDTGVSWIETLIQLKRIINKGYSPLIAHPERYRWCRRKNKKLITLSEMGCGTMVSARSFKLKRYAAAARNLLKDGLSHALCSDAHSIRDPILDGDLKKKLDESSSVPWQILTGDIPDMILNDLKLPELPLTGKRRFS